MTSAISAGQVLAHFRLDSKIGEGGMGVVWRAHDTRLDRSVAIKFLPDEFADDAYRLARFEREAKAVAALNHPHIVTIHSVEHCEGIRFLTMELVDGEALSNVIPRGGLPFERFLELAVPVVDAVSAAHSCGIIHRDLKPGNVMVSADGQVKILDFGLAKVGQGAGGSAAQDPETTQTDEWHFSGTVGYMAPEQLRGQPVDHRCDLFALGVVLYEMATGRKPFEGETRADVVAAVLKDDPPPIEEFRPDLTEPLNVILQACLEKEVHARTQSAADLRNDLLRLDRVGRLPARSLGPSIAVLPFTDMSREKDQAYFCEGVAEEILNALGRLRGVRVVPRSSSFQFRPGDGDSRSIGRELQVGTLLEGSVRKSGSRIRVTVQLIDVEQGFQLWSKSFDREIQDLFAIQEEIAQRIVQALRVTLSPGERVPGSRPPTRDVQAYDYYLRGRKYYYQYGPRDIEFAVQLFSRAVDLDPGFALAHAGLADCFSYIYLYSEQSEIVRRQADEASGRAIDLDGGAAQAWASRGVALSLSDRNPEAEAAFERAIELDARLFEAHYFYARHCFALGERERALQLYEQAREVCPDDYQVPLLMAQSYDDLGRVGEAEIVRRDGVEIAEKHLKLHPDDTRALYLAANGLVSLGEHERGVDWARRALMMDPEQPMLLYNVACIFAMTGRTDEAITCLDKAVDNGLKQRGWFENDSNLDALRGDPRFRAVIQRLA